MSTSHLKEALFVFKGGQYVASHESDKELLNAFLKKEGEADRFLDELKVLYTLPAFIKFRRHLRCKRAFQLLVGSVMLLYSLFFVASMVTTLSPGKSDTYEMLYLGFCGVLIAFFALVIYLAIAEARIIKECREPILQRIKTMLGEHFLQCYFEVNIDRNLTLRARPTDQLESGDDMDPTRMDYFDFIAAHHPEGEDFYKGTNPYEFDPYEKNVLADSIRQREEQMQKEQTKANKLNRIRAKLKPHS
jgi:hypothetical protein